MEEPAGVPFQPLPPWMSRTYLPLGPSSSTLVTLQFPQTYSGPSLPGLTWPWAYPPSDAAAATQVSVIGGSGGLTFIGGDVVDISTTIASPSTLPAIVSTPTSVPSASSRPDPPASTSDSESSMSATSLFLSLTILPTLESTTAAATPTSQPSGTLLSTTSAISTSSASSTTPPPASDPENSLGEKQKLTNGDITGIAIGTIAFVILLLLLALLCWRRRRKRHNSAFTMVDPENPNQPRMRETTSLLSAGSGRASAAVSDRQRYVVGAHAAVRRKGKQSTDEEGTGEDEGEGEGLMGYEDEARRYSGEIDRMEGPSILLNPANSAEGSARRLSMTTNHTKSDAQTTSTRTRASIISQFPVYDRRPSDRSSDNGHGGAAGGLGPGSNAARYSGSGQVHSSTGTVSEGDLFAAPPPRPPSRTRTVPNTNPAALLGLGRPPAPNGPRSSRFVSSSALVSETDLDPSTQQSSDGSAIPSSTLSDRRYYSLPAPAPVENDEDDPEAYSPPRHLSVPPPNSRYSALQRSVSNSSSRSLLGAPSWLKGFTWLKPFFGDIRHSAPAEANEAGQPGIAGADVDADETAADLEIEDVEEAPGGARLLPTATPVLRAGPLYRRVTTTAAAFDVQDLRDMAKRQTSRANVDASTTDGHETHPSAFVGSDDEVDSDDEGRSLMSSEMGGTVSFPGTARHRGRWSRATLGQPLQRISGISSVSLADIPSLSESMTSSIRARSKPRSGSGSLSARSLSSLQVLSGTRSASSTISRAGSAQTLSSHGHSHSSRSKSGSGSDSRGSRRGKARRMNNSSSGESRGSSSHGHGGSVRSSAYDKQNLRHVSESHEALPPLPEKPAAYK